MKKWHTLVLALAIVALIAAAGYLYTTLKDVAAPDRLMTAPAADPTAPATVPAEPATAEQETTQPDMTAPGFTVYDADGNAVTLESLRGKPVVLNFWATWCGYCVMEMPDFQEAYEEFGDRIHFMMVNVTDGYQETEAAARAFIAGQDFTFPVYYDLDLSAAMAYGISSMPQTFFIDAEGMAVAYAQGALDAASLRRGIGMLLGETN
jgi:peroxiredoxin